MRSGNTEARWKHRTQARTLARRVRGIIRDESADLGNRPGVAELFGFGDERGWVSNWRGLALRWFAR